MAQLTLVDLAALQGNDALTGLIEDVTTFAPEFSVFPAQTRAGTTYQIVRRTALPGSGFRNLNEGVTPVKSTFQKDVKGMFYLDSQLVVDEAIVKGDDRSVGDVLSIESRGVLEASIISIGTQIYYGVSADAKGFVGLRDQLVSSISAGGTTNTTSAYLVCLDPQGVQMLVGRDGEISLPNFTKQQVVDPNDSTKRMTAYVSNISAYLGLAVYSNQAVWSVKGISLAESSGVFTQALTDRLGARAISAVPMSRRNGLRWFMNRSAALTLQASRSSIGNQNAGPNGASAFSSFPTELGGVPITVTDSITDTENNT